MNSLIFRLKEVKGFVDYIRAQTLTDYDLEFTTLYVRKCYIVFQQLTRVVYIEILTGIKGLLMGVY